MKVAIVFDGDPETPDPDAGHPEGIVRGEFLPADTDVLIVWREWGEQFEGGSRIHFVGGGSWEHIGMKAAKRIEKALGAL